MTRQEFITVLRRELRKLPPEEIVAATEFYEEYFDEVLEALPTDGLTEEEILQKRARAEADLVEEIGGPRKAAKLIKSDYASRILDGEPTASGEKPSIGSRLSAVWWVIIGICSAPVSIPLAICIVIAAVSIIGSALSFMLSVYVGIIVGAAAAIGFIVVGIAALATAASTGVMLIGLGLMAAAVSAAAGVGAWIGTRELIRWLARVARNLNEKRRIKKMNQMRGGAGYERA